MPTTRLQLPSIGLTELQELISLEGLPKFRAKQIMDWRNKGVLNPENMGNIPQNIRQWLKDTLCCEPLTLSAKQCSEDGTRKYLFTLPSGKNIETVLIPESERGTVCVSSQVGCVLDCPFCHTGTQKFEANLSAGEIVAQVLAVKEDLRQHPMQEDLHHDVTHLVYMGMGEPMANEQGLHQSLAMLMSEEGLHISRRRITVSTSGLTPQITQLGEAYPVNLAISLHSAINSERDILVPINIKYPLEILRECLNTYPLAHQRHITLEYLLLDGINDREEDIQALVNFVNPERERINLIRFNPYPNSPYSGTPTERMNSFAKSLISKGIRATVRRSRGQDIMAACGQLKSSNTTKTTS
ncbi:MAG: 23S rRNA (adenine(2503)-C(2))-methyltransferase RlmN [Mariprofundaceae bacterium]|nr:23S rRNA (adenine(2503)-C(2))-methyltransferase RlmN [Mariprofundaceae bacterium]